MKNYYEILGISNHAGIEDIKSAFRKKSKEYHPEITWGRQDSARKFIEVKEAYEILSKQTLRTAYDSALQGNTTGFDFSALYAPQNAQYYTSKPMKFFEKDFEKYILTWLSEGEYTPNDILDNISSQRSLCFLPFYHIQKAYSGDFRARLGLDKTRNRTIYNYNTKRYEEEAYRVTEYYQVGHKFHNEVSLFALNQEVGKGSMFEAIEKELRKNQKTIDDLYQIDLSSFDKKQIHEPEYQSEDLFEQRLKNELVNQIKTQELRQYNYNTVSHADVDVDFTNISDTLFYVPYWVLVYTYKQEQHYAFINASDTLQRGGTRPIDKECKKTVRAINLSYWGAGITSTGLAAYAAVLGYQDYNQSNTLEMNIYSVIIAIGGLLATHLFSKKKIKAIKQTSYNIRQHKLKSKLATLFA